MDPIFPHAYPKWLFPKSKLSNVVSKHLLKLTKIKSTTQLTAFVKDTLIQCTAAPRFTAFLWPVLLFLPVFGGTWGWTGHLSVFLPFNDWLTVDSLGAIVLLEAARPSALYSASLHNLPRCVCPSSVSHRSVRCSWKLHRALLWLVVKVVIACTPCLTVVCFYLSQKLHDVVMWDYRCTVFSHACA